MRYLALLLVLTACTTPPQFADGSGCWRYGVAESGNTGRMSPTPALDVPVVSLGYDDLLTACGVTDTRTLAGYYRDGRSLAVRACYDPLSDTIYEYNLNWGRYYSDHERCHIRLGRTHNRCNDTGYGIGKNCNWDET
jgi:hypothetical protein